MARKGEGKIFVITQTGAAEIDGQRYTFYAGVTRVREGHPLLKSLAPDFYKEVDETVHYEWETATQAPGEQRGAQRGPSSGSRSEAGR